MSSKKYTMESMNVSDPIAYLEGYDFKRENCVTISLFKNKVLAIGRKKTGQIDQRVERYSIPDNRISSTHCFIWCVQFDSSTPCICYLKDVATNQCFVNGKPIGKGNYTIINHGDVIDLVFGLKVVFKLSDEAKDIEYENLSENGVSSGKTRDRNWVILPKVIGTGTFGKIQIAHKVNEGFKFYAVKVTRPIKLNGELKIESSILSRLDHPNIIKIHDAIINQRNTNVRIYQDLAIGGDLFSYLSQDRDTLEPLPECEALLAVFQIVLALKYLHSKGVVHRDLKLDNILILGVPVRYPHLVLADFGIAKQNLPLTASQADSFSQTKLNYERLRKTNEKDPENSTLQLRIAKSKQPYWMNTMVGTAEYAAPEINLIGNIDENDITDRSKKYNEKIDTWSLGIITHIILSGISPFYSDTLEKIVEKSKEGKIYLESSKWKPISNEAKNFVKGCLDIESDNRFNITQCLEHDWFTKDNRKAIISRGLEKIIKEANFDWNSK